MHHQLVCCCLWEDYRNTHTHAAQPTGKTRLTHRDGDCSITMVTQMGPRERLASTEAGGKWHTHTHNTDKLTHTVYCHMFTGRCLCSSLQSTEFLNERLCVSVLNAPESLIYCILLHNIFTSKTLGASFSQYDMIWCLWPLTLLL